MAQGHGHGGGATADAGMVMGMEERNLTYRRFLNLFKVGAIGCIILLIFLFFHFKG